MDTMKTYDVLVLGSGIGGLSFANYFLERQQQKSTTERLSLLVVSKGEADQTNTAWAQGGIAAPVTEEDSVSLHVQDTLNAGAFVNDVAVTEKIIGHAATVIEDLIAWGIQFDKNTAGDFDLGLEGGHSNPRILHHRDVTGANIQSALFTTFNRLQGEFKAHCVAINAVKHDKGFTVLLYDKVALEFHRIYCAHLVFATGGIGQLFLHTTNTKDSNGDGIFLAHQLGATLRDLAMVQFHPTGLYAKGGKDFLISEALRGAGAELLNHDHLPFMLTYDKRGSLAPRDIVSRALWTEMDKSQQPFVWLDATKIDLDHLNQHFSTIIKNCIERVGIDPRKEFIPVMPIQHYSCGGILTDEFGQSTLDGLYAIGECANTGFHGANRLASNSLLEGICMAKFACNQICDQVSGQANDQASNQANDQASGQVNDQASGQPTPLHNSLLPVVPDQLLVDVAEVRSILSAAAGVVRSRVEMKQAVEKLISIKRNAAKTPFDLAHVEGTVALELSILLLTDALSKEDSIGVHYVV